MCATGRIKSVEARCLSLGATRDSEALGSKKTEHSHDFREQLPIQSTISSLPYSPLVLQSFSAFKSLHCGGEPSSSYFKAFGLPGLARMDLCISNSRWPRNSCNLRSAHRGRFSGASFHGHVGERVAMLLSHASAKHVSMW